MAAQAEIEDPLYNFRLSIKENTVPILATSADPAPTDTVTDLAQATHITFNVDDAHRTFSFTSPTRFAPDNKPIDLRSCYFAWVNKDASVTDYFAAVQTVNEELPSGAGGSVQNLTFAQKIELIAWLSSETESSDSITAIDSTALSAAANDAAAIAGGKGVPLDSSSKRTGGKMMDARLLQIYDGERRMGDHNTVLRGTKNVVRAVFPPRLQNHQLTSDTGLHPVPQDRRNISPQPALGPQTPRLAPALDLPRLQPAKTRAQAPRTHHPFVAVRVLAPAHGQHQAVPRRRRLHANRRGLGLDKHGARAAPDAQHFLVAHHLHPCRQHHLLQADVLVPRRRHLHHGPDLAVQDVQVQ
jgi:hypothetical protein